MKISLLLLLMLPMWSAMATNLEIRAGEPVVSSLSKGPQVDIHGRIFSEVKIRGFVNSQNVGGPSLPVKLILLNGRPENIDVSVTRENEYRLENTIPAPAQPEPCRCESDKVQGFAYDFQKYAIRNPQYKMTYLGAFRGQGVTQLEIPVAKWDAKQNSVSLAKTIRVETNAREFQFANSNDSDFLVIVPDVLKDGVRRFVGAKKAQGYNVLVKTLLTPELTKEKVSQVVREAYTNDGADFVLFVGDENTIPMFQLDTTGSNQTPSDLPYLVMDGADDHIPDLYAGRIAASTAEEVENRLLKAVEFEEKSNKNKTGLLRMIGIASNEGSNPSDDEYVRGMESLLENSLNFQTRHFYQNDSDSNPETLNAEMNSGASWVTYVGHGSGSSWPSMNATYTTNDVLSLNNVDSVKPVVIDVACQNGRLLKNYLGTQFSSVWSVEGLNPYGASAYYGGTVNISWNPPAIMAQGIYIEHVAHNFRHVGEALLAGQLYLAKNWANSADVIDNFEWYHLQGDPSMGISH